MTLPRLTLLLLALTACKDDAPAPSDDSEPLVGNNDEDADGYPDTEDCDDNDPLVNPGMTETCDGRDNDCDGATDEDVTTTFYTDADADGFGDDANPVQSCERPAGTTLTGNDCDDQDPLTYPGAVERCDELDNDCDGVVDDDATGLGDWYADGDGDGYGDPEVKSTECARPEGYVADDTDCDDGRAAVHPDATELCNDLDDDCDGTTDEPDAADAPTWYNDGDGDTYGDPTDSTAACTQPAGHVADATDCDDADATAWPGAPEVCDDADNDCDGTTDEPDALDAATWYRDADSDRYGDLASTTLSCEAPTGYVADATDCDDSASAVNPGATELCNSVDDDCDGTTDEADAADAPTWYTDGDGDLYGDASKSQRACTAPSGTVSNDDDCDDSRAAVNPGATELCNSRDDDCDGTTDEADAADAPTWYTDGDGDLYGDASKSQRACTAPSGTVSDATDCDDSRAAVNPGATELCNSRDDDCDGTTDEPDAADATVWYTDADADLYGDPLGGTAACTAPSGTVANDEDCDDDEPLANPGLSEICDDGIDNDCDGTPNGCSLSGDIDLATSDAILTGEVAGDAAGFAVSAAGDVNADGYADLLVGSLYNDVGGSNAGKAYLFHGPVSGTLSLSTADLILVGESASDYAGYALAPAGDVNGDGAPDLLIGAMGRDTAASNAGAVYLVTGSWTGTVDLSLASAILQGEALNDNAGIFVSGAGDTNGDGYDDVLIGAYGSDRGGTNSGAAYLVTGPVSSGSLSAASAILVGEDMSDGAGYVVGGGQDLDGDGLDDLVIGAHLAELSKTDSGLVYVLSGPVSGTVDLSAADAILEGRDAGDRAGLGLAALPDVDGDGYGDVLIGAYTADEGSGTQSGAAYLVYGPLPASLNLGSADVVFVGEATSHQAGYAVSGAGDVDGDGFQDLLIGAVGGNANGSQSGQAYLVYGVPSAGTSLLSAAGARLLGEASADQASWSVAGPGDVDGDGMDDLLVGARGNDRGGASAGAAFLVLGAGW